MPHVMRWPPDRAGKQAGDAVLENLGGSQLYGALEVIGFEEFLDRRHREGRVGMKVAPKIKILVAGDSRLQNITPSIAQCRLPGRSLRRARSPNCLNRNSR